MKDSEWEDLQRMKRRYLPKKIEMTFLRNVDDFVFDNLKELVQLKRCIEIQISMQFRIGIFARFPILLTDYRRLCSYGLISLMAFRAVTEEHLDDVLPINAIKGRIAEFRSTLDLMERQYSVSFDEIPFLPSDSELVSLVTVS